MTDDKQLPGNLATRPGEIPLAGWWQITKRALQALDDNNLSLLAAGVAFYLLLALFPLMTAFLSLYGLLADPAELANQLVLLSGWVPEQALTLISDQLGMLISSRGSTLGLGVLFGVLLGLWGAAKGAEALARALNVTYRERSSKNILLQRLIGMVIALGLVTFLLIAVFLVAGVSFALELLYLPASLENLLGYIRWPLLWLLAITALALLFRFAPAREHPSWRWLSPGALAATMLWLGGSALFSLYAKHFGSYNEAYGSMGAVILLMLWFWLTVFAVLLGAQLNAELEFQTRRDTTSGAPQPIGQRGAYVADHHAGDRRKPRDVSLNDA